MLATTTKNNIEKTLLALDTYSSLSNTFDKKGTNTRQPPAPKKPQINPTIKPIKHTNLFRFSIQILFSKSLFLCKKRTLFFRVL